MASISFTAAEIAAIAAQVAPLLSPPSTPPPPPVIIPPVAGAFYIYQNGVFNWAADYSWNATIDYQDKTGEPGKTCIAVHITAPNGGFQPYAQGKKFDVSPYKYLTYSIKPTIPNQVIATGFAAINDVADGVPVTVAGPGITKYGPALVVGQFTSYKVPLADFALTNQLIQKFTIADGTGVSTNLYYVDNIALTL